MALFNVHTLVLSIVKGCINLQTTRESFDKSGPRQLVSSPGAIFLLHLHE